MPTFKEPHVFKRSEDNPSQFEIDKKASASYVLLEALGRPRVIYSVKENLYYKDTECKKTFSDDELNELELPLPIKILTERKKLIDEMLRQGGPEAVNMTEIYRLTSPSVLTPPERIRAKLVEETPEDRMIRRINRSKLGR